MTTWQGTDIPLKYSTTWFPDPVRICVRLLLLALSAIPLPGQTEPKNSLTICKDFGCKSTQTVALSKQHWQRIAAHFSTPPITPEKERDAIARAIAEFESIVGPLTNTEQEKGGNVDGYGLPGQMDCIDESTNTTSYLHAIERNGFLRWHITGKRAFRRPFIFDQHWTATIEQVDTGSRWAVDSWFLDNGYRPYVQAIDRWYRKASLPVNPDSKSGKTPRRVVTVER